MIGAGIDAGSRSIKVVLYDSLQGCIVCTAIADQGVDQGRLAAEVFERALKDGKVERSNISTTIATGYGRKVVHFADSTITEITCHAKGVRYLAPEARTIIEIGGQDSKIISLDEAGLVKDFSMNDRCAAGSGRFLEMVAGRLGVELDGLGKLACNGDGAAQINSTCVVFAETEIIGLLAEGTSSGAIAAGVQKAIAQRIAAMALRSIVPEVYFTGGVALQPGMLRALEEALGCTVKVSRLPQYTGALGAAILASERTR